MASRLPRIILASTSPRRIGMFKAIRIPFRAVAPDTDETAKAGESPRALVRRLAREKAESVASRVRGPRVIIAADTIVVAPGGRKILGKPRDRAEALRMLRSLAGRTHVVHTGYCLLACGPGARSRSRIVSRVVSSRVTMRRLSPADVARYFATGESLDKAGAYAAQGFGATLIDRIGGSYTNVVGLPMSQLLADLEKLLGIGPFGWLPRRRRGTK